MLAHRLRRWLNIKTTLVQRLVSAGWGQPGVNCRATYPPDPARSQDRKSKIPKFLRIFSDEK